MSASVDNESEILLGNKQLLAVFAVVALLLAVAFTGGYMLGKNSAEKKPELAQTGTAATEAVGGPITQKITPDEPPATKTEPTAEAKPDAMTAPEPVPHKNEPAVALADISRDREEPVLGRHSSSVDQPRAGQIFVQVAAVAHKEASATAEVLRQHDFQARIAPAPGSTTVFRVLVGPAKDSADLRSTEDALRKIGYTKCFVQHY